MLRKRVGGERERENVLSCLICCRVKGCKCKLAYALGGKEKHGVLTLRSVRSVTVCFVNVTSVK